METIKCKECGKELSKKAEICPNCGIRIKKKSVFREIGVVFIGIIIFIIICILICWSYRKINNAVKNNYKNEYTGTWKLSTSNEVFIPNKTHYNDETKQQEPVRIVLDNELSFTIEQVYWKLGGEINCDYDELTYKRCELNAAFVHLAKEKDEIAINFSDTTGTTQLLCFKLSNKDTLKQISCKGVAFDDLNPDGFYANGGLGENLGIIYKKVK